MCLVGGGCGQIKCGNLAYLHQKIPPFLLSIILIPLPHIRISVSLDSISHITKIMKAHITAHLTSSSTLLNVLESPHPSDQAMKTTTTIWTDMTVQNGKHLVTFPQNGNTLGISPQNGNTLGISPQNGSTLVIFIQNGNNLGIFHTVTMKNSLVQKAFLND